MRTTPPRLFVLLAHDDASAVTIRRGPSSQVCTIGWDRRRDKFKVGQWLKGRIYERKCDLSPDGNFLVYSAHKGWLARREMQGAYTVISMAPYLKAIAIYQQGTTYGGGGYFSLNGQCYLDGGITSDLLTIRTPGPRPPPLLDKDPFTGYSRGLFETVYPIRLKRDGWTLLESRRLGSKHAMRFVTTYEKPLVHKWVLRKSLEGETERHELVRASTEETIACPDWEWADLDGKRLVFVKAGKLFAVDIGRRRLLQPAELYDFNGMKFEAIEAPY